MIAATANFLHCDVYDLELTAVKDNTHLRKLMIEISKRAIVVIEDIDCSLHITGRRKVNNTAEKDNIKNDDLKEAIIKKAKEEEEGGKTDDDNEESKSKVTLSGLLNFMDGLWSTSGGERIFIFTIEKIDDKFVRRGRMDKHIEMSYCSFEAFKVLAKNCLKLEHHDKFEKIMCLLSETDVSPADVAENLMTKSVEMSVEECLENLTMALSKVKEEVDGGEGKKLKEGMLEDEGNGENLRPSKVKPSKSRIKGIFLKYNWEFREKLC